MERIKNFIIDRNVDGSVDVTGTIIRSAAAVIVVAIVGTIIVNIGLALFG